MFICFDPWISCLATYSKDIVQIMEKTVQTEINHAVAYNMKNWEKQNVQQ